MDGEEQVEQLEEQVNLDQQEQETEDESQGIAGATLFDSLYSAADEEEPTSQDATNVQAALTGDDIVTQPQEEVVEEPKKKVKKIHKKEIVDPDLPEPNVDAYQPMEQEQEDTSFLLPEEKEQLKLVKHIAKKSGKGEDAHLIEFFRKQKEYVEKRMDEDPDLDLINDTEYQSFVERNRPNVTAADLKDAERELLIEEAEERALKRLKPQIQKQDIETRRIKLKPQVDAAKSQATNKALSMVPEDLANQLKESSPEDVAKSNPYEFNIVNTAVTNASNYASEFLDIAKGMKDFDPRNGTHAELRDWLVKEQDVFINSGQTRDQHNRPFMRRERYMQLPPEEAKKYWTWSDEQCVDILFARAKESMDSGLQQHAQAMQAYGQQPSVARKQQPQQSVQQCAPPVKPTPRAGGTPMRSQQNSDTGSPVLSVLGL